MNTSGDAAPPVRERGTAAVERAYRDVLAGRAAPDTGHVLSLWDAAA